MPSSSGSVGLARAHPLTQTQAMGPSRQTRASTGQPYPLGRWSSKIKRNKLLWLIVRGCLDMCTIVLEVLMVIWCRCWCWCWLFCATTVAGVACVARCLSYVGLVGFCYRPFHHLNLLFFAFVFRRTTLIDFSPPRSIFPPF